MQFLSDISFLPLSNLGAAILQILFHPRYNLLHPQILLLKPSILLNQPRIMILFRGQMNMYPLPCTFLGVFSIFFDFIDIGVLVFLAFEVLEVIADFVELQPNSQLRFCGGSPHQA
jgi:hypothetical protein